MRRAVTAGTGDPKKNQAWAPFPERDLSIATGTRTSAKSTSG